MESIEHGGLTVKIEYDPFDNECPLGWECGNGFEFVTFEHNSLLAEHHDYADADDALAGAKEKGLAVFPLLKYEHGNVLYSVRGGYPFDCPWDSGQVGFVFVEAEAFDNAEKAAQGFCETVTQWCNGEIYHYTVEDAEGNHLDSCGGMYGFDYCRNEGIEAADVEIKNIKKQRQDRLKRMIRARVPLHVRERELGS